MTTLENKKVKGTIEAISISDKKGVPKKNIDKATLKDNFGIINDAHAGEWHRQVSLLAIESVNKIKAKLPTIMPGAFAENISTRGINLVDLPIGTKIRIGEDAILEVSQIGKECHSRCAIYHTVGDCVMPREGIFSRVIKGGEIKTGDSIGICA